MRRTVATILIWLAALSVGQPVVAHATSHAPKSTVDFVVGDGKYLVYSRGPTDRKQVLYVRSQNGKVRSLGLSPTAKRAGYVDFTLVGSTLTLGYFDDPVFWWNLAAHTSGKVKLNIRDNWDGSVPGGFVVFTQAKSGVETFYRETIRSGHIAPLNPALRGIVAGPTGYMGVVRATGKLAFQPYGGGALVALRIPPKVDTGERSCDEIWEYYVRCILGNGDFDGAYSSTEMLPLNGKMGFDVQTRYGPVALRHVLVWGKSRLIFRSHTGHITKSKTPGPVVGEALDQAIVVSANGSKIEGVSSASATPTILAHS
jgi:hypothetical protein